jgi:hypothetical protein
MHLTTVIVEFSRAHDFAAIRLQDRPDKVTFADLIPAYVKDAESTKYLDFEGVVKLLRSISSKGGLYHPEDSPIRSYRAAESMQVTPQYDLCRCLTSSLCNCSYGCIYTTTMVSPSGKESFLHLIWKSGSKIPFILSFEAVKEAPQTDWSASLFIHLLDRLMINLK